jgi:membrane-bound metal-dependent hydrolase YbcI (DUF457 family)
MVLSIIPDIDIIFDLFTRAQIHRGPTHSVIVAIVAFIPFFVIYRKKAVPYFLALISHSLIGDLPGGGLQLLWPISNAKFGFPIRISVFNPLSVLVELVLFVFALLVLNRSGDWRVFFSSGKSNLLLIIPIFTVLLPTTIGYPFSAPLVLTEPVLAVAHLFYLVLFSIAVLKTLGSVFKVRLRRAVRDG